MGGRFITVGRTGLGDRMFLMANTQRVARQLGMEPVMVWAKTSHLNCPARALFDVDNMDIELWNERPDMSIKRIPPNNIVYSDEDVVVKNGFNHLTIKGEKQNPQHVVNLDCVKIHQEHWDTAKDRAAKLDISEAMGVHVRRGDIVDLRTLRHDKWALFKFFQNSAYFDAIEKFGDGRELFVATDGPEELQAFNERFPGRIKSYGDGGEVSRETERGIVAAMQDLLLLGQCSIILSSWSYFGMAASILCGKPRIMMVNKIEYKQVN